MLKTLNVCPSCLLHILYEKKKKFKFFLEFCPLNRKFFSINVQFIQSNISSIEQICIRCFTRWHHIIPNPTRWWHVVIRFSSDQKLSFKKTCIACHLMSCPHLTPQVKWHVVMWFSFDQKLSFERILCLFNSSYMVVWFCHRFPPV